MDSRKTQNDDRQKNNGQSQKKTMNSRKTHNDDRQKNK
jgi:hypothetical protein